jgi:poly(3-hydroxybutyrate) depolymerase
MAIVINSFTPETAVYNVGSVATFSVNATETNNVALLYQWQRKLFGETVFSNITGATSDTYNTPTLTLADNNSVYRVRVYTTSPAQESFAPSEDGRVLTVTSSSILLFPVEADSEYFVDAGDSVTFAYEATFSTQANATDQTKVNNISYQWQVSTDNGATWSNVVLNANTVQVDTTVTLNTSPIAYTRRSTLTFNSVDFSQNFYRYRAIVTSVDAANSPFTTNSSVLLVSPFITITKQPGTGGDTTGTVRKYKPLDPGSGKVNLSIEATTSATTAYSDLSYQWQWTTDRDVALSGGPFNDILGTEIEFDLASGTNAQSKSLEIINLAYIETAYYFKCEVYGTANEDTVYSNYVEITTSETIEINTPVVDTFSNEDRYGDVPNRTSFLDSINTARFFVKVDTTVPTGTEGVTAIKWQRKDPGTTTWYDLTEYISSTESAYTTPPLRRSIDNGAYYRAQIDATRATNEPYYSPNVDGALLTVYRYVFIESQPNSIGVYANQQASFAVTADVSSPATITYQWQVRTSSTGAWQNITNNTTYSGTNTNLLLVNGVTTTFNNYAYRVIVNAPDTLSSVTSDEAYLNVLADTITFISSLNSVTIFEGQLLQFNVSAQSASLEQLKFQWQKSTNYNPASPNSAVWTNLSGQTTGGITGTQITIAPSDGQTFAVDSISYPVMGSLYVPTSLTSSSIDVVVLYHGTLQEGGNVTIAQAAQTSLEFFLDENELNIRDKIIFSVAYPQDHISNTRQYNLPNVGTENPAFLMGDNLPYARAALKWAINSLNAFMASNGISKTIDNVYTFGHSQGGKLVAKMNTLETGVTKVIANAPGPIQFDQTCAISPSNTSCAKVGAIHGASTGDGSEPYRTIGLETYTTGHNAPLLFTQALDDPTGGGNQPTWLQDYINDINAISTNPSVEYVTTPTGGHAAFTTDDVLQEAIRISLESTSTQINVGTETTGYTSTYTVSSASSTDDAYYRVRVTSNGGSIRFSNVVYVDVVTLNITITKTYPNTLTVIEGVENFATFEITAIPSVSDTIFYQWQFSLDGVTYSNYSSGFNGSSATTNVFIPPALSRSQSGIRIRCRVTGTLIPGTYTSTPCVITVDRRFTYFAGPEILVAQANKELTFNLNPIVTGGGVPLYQWQISSNGTTWTNIANETGESYTISANNLTIAAYNGKRIRCLVTVSDVTTYEYFRVTTGTVITNINPPGTATATVPILLNIVSAPVKLTYYSKETAKTGSAIGTVICIPKKAGYTTGQTGDDTLAWLEGPIGYDPRFVGYIPLTYNGAFVTSGTNLVSAANFPELARILGNTYGGSITGSYPKYGGNFGLPMTFGKKLMGTGNVNNNVGSPSVYTEYDGRGNSGGDYDSNTAGSYGGQYNYDKSEQLPSGNPNQANQPDGIAGIDPFPRTFTLGNYTTTGWTEASTTVNTTYRETISWGAGPLGLRRLSNTTVHFHEATGWVPDPQQRRVGNWDRISNNPNCRYINTDSGAWLNGPGIIGEENSNFEHTHGLNLGEADAEGQGHNADRGGVGSNAVGDFFTEDDTGSSITEGLVTMSQQSNTIWNDHLNFYLRNAEQLPIIQKHFRLKYMIKAW